MNPAEFDRALENFASTDPDLCQRCTDLVHYTYSVSIPQADGETPTFYLSVTKPSPIALAWLDRAVVFAAQRRGWSADAYLIDLKGTFDAVVRDLTEPGTQYDTDCRASDIAIARLYAYTRASQSQPSTYTIPGQED